MALWIVFALMTGAAVLAVLWPLSRRSAGPERDADRAFYQDQIAEIERDRERGLLNEAEAEAARAEAGRRLLRAAKASASEADSLGEPALRRRRAVSAIALSIVPLIAIAVYGAYGAPQIPAQPLAARLKEDPQKLDMAAAVARIEAHLAQNPNDGAGWEVIAPVYLRAGRLEDAAKAYGAALRALGETPARLTNLGEALVLAKDGVVTAEARSVLDRAVSLDPKAIKARFYLARGSEQDGDKDAARTQYAAIIEASPPNAPWVAAVRERLSGLGGEGAAAVAALPPAERQAAIRGMVEGLAARLESQGGSSEEWQRLIRSYMVLGEREKADAALAKAREALAADRSAVEGVEAVARQAGLDLGGPKP